MRFLTKLSSCTHPIWILHFTFRQTLCTRSVSFGTKSSLSGRQEVAV